MKTLKVNNFVTVVNSLLTFIAYIVFVVMIASRKAQTVVNVLKLNPTNRARILKKLRGDKMTYAEAHTYLENLQREFTNNRFVYGNNLISVNGKAIEALEKQIPKIVKRFGVFEVAKCNCGSYVDLSDNFCRKCGQALKWG